MYYSKVLSLWNFNHNPPSTDNNKVSSLYVMGCFVFLSIEISKLLITVAIPILASINANLEPEDKKTG